MLTSIHGIISSTSGAVNTWELLGNSISLTSLYRDVTALSTTDVLISTSAATDRLNRYTFDGTDWTEVGTSYPLPDIASLTIPKVAALDATSFAYFDSINDLLRKYIITGDPSTTTTQDGNALSITTTNLVGFDAVSASRIVLLNDVLNEIQVYDFNGTDWVTVGNGYSWAFSGGQLVSINATDIMVYDATNGLLKKFTFDETDFVEVGTGAVLPGISGIAAVTDLAVFSETIVSVVNSGTEALWLYDLSAGMSVPATLVGEKLIFDSSLPRITTLTATEVCHTDYLYGQLSTYTKPT